MVQRVKAFNLGVLPRSDVPRPVLLQNELACSRPLAIALITSREGTERFRKFWRYYEVKWGIGLRSIAWVYVPIGALAPVGLMLYFKNRDVRTQNYMVNYKSPPSEAARRWCAQAWRG